MSIAVAFLDVGPRDNSSDVLPVETWESRFLKNMCIFLKIQDEVSSRSDEVFIRAVHASCFVYVCVHTLYLGFQAVCVAAECAMSYQRANF